MSPGISDILVAVDTPDDIIDVTVTSCDRLMTLACWLA